MLGLGFLHRLSCRPREVGRLGLRLGLLLRLGLRLLLVSLVGSLGSAWWCFPCFAEFGLLQLFLQL